LVVEDARHPRTASVRTDHGSSHSNLTSYPALHRNKGRTVSPAPAFCSSIAVADTGSFFTCPYIGDLNKITIGAASITRDRVAVITSLVALFCGRTIYAQDAITAGCQFAVVSTAVTVRVVAIVTILTTLLIEHAITASPAAIDTPLSGLRILRVAIFEPWHPSR
jgi:hypothetical protein